ncbi:hypothetical protein [Rhodoferax ferrireducens]|uniref:hypothetical protein n=1 Tax=Rhodoferax ferrireducens TaxID=192843 RepID=UPI000E0CCCEA|nr:hypothetical protein [Rhodoferax ferrireducens]
MNCNCKKDLEEKLTERFKEQSPLATVHGTELQGYGFAIVGDSMKVLGYMPVKQSAMVPLKSGATKLKTTTQNMFFSFCPFCGVKA